MAVLPQTVISDLLVSEGEDIAQPKARMSEKFSYNITPKQMAEALRRPSKNLLVDADTYGEICHMFEAAMWDLSAETAEEGLSSAELVRQDLDDDEALRFASDEARLCAQVVSSTTRWREKNGFRPQLTPLECQSMMAFMWEQIKGSTVPDDDDLRDRHEMLAERMFKLIVG